jgi:hypothetical protein
MRLAEWVERAEQLLGKGIGASAEQRALRGAPGAP